MARPPSVTALINSFRRQRPLRAGSLIITVFGDAVAPRGGTIALGSLIELVAPFGLTERLVRTSAARLADGDWLDNVRIGRLSEYALSNTGKQRFADATRRIYSGPVTDWQGHWTLVLLPDVSATARRQLRQLLHWEGFGELMPGLFISPTQTAMETRTSLDLQGFADAPLLLETRAIAASDHQRLISLGWQLEDLAARYQRFIRNFGPIADLIRRGPEPAPEDAFLVRTLLVHEYRKVQLRDPHLPASLLPAAWPGVAAYELCSTIYNSILQSAEAHLTAVATTLAGPLPPPESSVFHRFPSHRAISCPRDQGNSLAK